MGRKRNAYDIGGEETTRKITTYVGGQERQDRMV
jgi:hypothetical protein